MTTPNQSRAETVARIIDPEFWAMHDVFAKSPNRDDMNAGRQRIGLPTDTELVAPSLAKAQSILDLPPLNGGEEGAREVVADRIGGGSTFNREDRLEMADDILAALATLNVQGGEADRMRPETKAALDQRLAGKPGAVDALNGQGGGDGLTTLRADGWRVAVHNDYRLNGEDYTFWLFTHPDGRWIKGEGRTDNEAILAALSVSAPPVVGESQ